MNNKKVTLTGNDLLEIAVALDNEIAKHYSAGNKEVSFKLSDLKQKVFSLMLEQEAQ